VVGLATLASLPALLRNFRRKKDTFAWDDPKKYQKERYTDDVRYYAREAGFDIIDETVETGDGFLLRVHRVINPRYEVGDTANGGYPILLLHGLFQCSGAFITSEERSIAFWLSEHGYQVFLGNTRGIFGMGHTSFSRDDPRFWDWTIRDQAMYDLPALVNHVCTVTGYPKIAFIGHSQGNGLAFLSLSKSLCPCLGRQLSIFIALAPAVYAGPLTHGFPFTVLRKVPWAVWKWLFGVLDYMPLMRHSYNWVPARLFAHAGYVMFAYLFSWTDTHWLKRRKTKVFMFTPTPVSSASIFWCILFFS
jgi:pimeloyl-ACP methyl ester carboxylesterase